MQCTSCSEPALKQCDDHDIGYGVCDSCLARFGREAFCLVNCRAHGPIKTIWDDDGTNGPVLICLPPSRR